MLGGVSLSGTAQAPLAPIPDSTTIRVEGEPVQIRLQRYAPRGVPLQMGVPENSFITKVEESPNFKRVRLSAGREGRITNDEARINIMWSKTPITADEMQTWLFQSSQGRGITLQSVRNSRSPYAWVEREWRFERNPNSRDRIVGRAIVGQLNGRHFVVVHQVPVSMAEGYGPRIDAVLKTLQSR